MARVRLVAIRRRRTGFLAPRPFVSASLGGTGMQLTAKQTG
jgi:hypothetical protein